MSVLGLMKKTGKGRIINVSSIAAKYAKKFTVEALHAFPGVVMVYHHSKLCNILFTKELSLRLKGSDITTYSLHPGAVKTDIFRHIHGILKVLTNLVINSFFKVLLKF